MNSSFIDQKIEIIDKMIEVNNKRLLLLEEEEKVVNKELNVSYLGILFLVAIIGSFLYLLFFN